MKIKLTKLCSEDIDPIVGECLHYPVIGYSIIIIDKYSQVTITSIVQDVKCIGTEHDLEVVTCNSKYEFQVLDVTQDTSKFNIG